MFKTYVNASAGVSGPGGMSPVTSPSAGKPATAGGWSPSVLYLVVLVAAEILIVGYVTKKL